MSQVKFFSIILPLNVALAFTPENGSYIQGVVSCGKAGTTLANLEFAQNATRLLSTDILTRLHRKKFETWTATSDENLNVTLLMPIVSADKRAKSTCMVLRAEDGILDPCSCKLKYKYICKRHHSACPKTSVCSGNLVYFQNKKNFFEAYRECLDNQMELWAVLNQSETKEIQDQVKRLFISSSYWVGLVRETWQFEDGSSALGTNLPWDKNEPQTSGGDCTVVTKSTGRLKSVDCTKSFTYWCNDVRNNQSSEVESQMSLAALPKEKVMQQVGCSQPNVIQTTFYVVSSLSLLAIAISIVYKTFIEKLLSSKVKLKSTEEDPLLSGETTKEDYANNTNPMYLMDLTDGPSKPSEDQATCKELGSSNLEEKNSAITPRKDMNSTETDFEDLHDDPFSPKSETST